MDFDAFRPLVDYWPYLVFPLIVAPFVVVGLSFGVWPTRRAIWAFSPVALASCFQFLFGDSLWSWVSVVSFDVLILLLFIGDSITAAFAGRGVEVARQTESVASLRRPHKVELSIENRSQRAVVLEILDDSSTEADFAPPLEDENLELERNEELETSQERAFFARRTIEPGVAERLAYRLVWRRRGVFEFEFVALRFFSALGFWNKLVKKPCRSTFRVYPNLCQLEQIETLARASRLNMLGVRRIRRIGQDAEFERLRDYTLDDQYKFIDWRATARRNKLIVRDFQTTRNQRIILALDAGRMTLNSSRGLTLFDGALNACLALAYVALKQGDEVGALVFSDRVQRFLPPRGGASQINALIRNVFDVFPSRVESRYDRAFAYLASRSPKRALVVLATNVLDERNAAQIEQATTRLSDAYLPLGLFLRERSLYDAIERYDKFEKSARGVEGTLNDSESKQGRLALWLKQFRDDREPVDELERLFWRGRNWDEAPPEDLFYNAGAAAEILNWRKKLLRKLEAKGALTLDVFAEDATAPLIGKYLEIKARRLL